jgi:hypothetical protein
MKLSIAEIDSQHVELLPARTVMSLFTLGGKGGGGGGIPGGGDATQAGVVCIGQLSVALGLILGAGSADGTGTACNAIANN